MVEADAIITITSRRGIADGGACRPGTHLACMGTDTKGKQEVEVARWWRTVFADEVAQSVTIGEAQHAVAAGLIGGGRSRPWAACCHGRSSGAAVMRRRSRCSMAPAWGCRIWRWQPSR
jgi:alanine dehydrogenase